jgi:hypothetical protein
MSHYGLSYAPVKLQFFRQGRPSLPVQVRRENSRHARSKAAFSGPQSTADRRSLHGTLSEIKEKPMFIQLKKRYFGKQPGERVDVEEPNAKT